MPNWGELLQEVQQAGNAHDQVRRKYLKRLSNRTGRNTILYYSGWLDKPIMYPAHPQPFTVNDTDKNGFMSAIHGMDRKKGLDLVLHTPGGDLAAAESLVSYLRSMFGKDIRAIVPQLALSAGTMMACACSEIVMGRHSSLGPIDPQFGGLPAHGIVEEFEKAAEEIAVDPSRIPLWQPIIGKYNPTLIGECQKAITWAQTIVKEWLMTGMFARSPNREAKAERIVQELGDHVLTLSHARHIEFDKAKEIGLKVTPLEKDGGLQDALLTVHHLAVQTMASTPAVKLIENQKGIAYIQSMQATSP
jgi:ATP-dependent protease ClpP protease subunit